MILYLTALGLYTHNLRKNAKNRIVMSFLSQTLSETAVHCAFKIILSGKSYNCGFFCSFE